MMPKGRGLTAKQEQFVQEYMIDLNATQAAIRAGYKPSSAEDIGRQLLRKTPVAAAIARAKAERARRTGFNADRVLEELALIAFADLGEFVEFGPGGIRIKDAEGLDVRMRRAMAEVTETKTETGGSLKFKLHDKLGALKLLGQHLGMFVDKVEHRHSGEVKVSFAKPEPSGNMSSPRGDITL